MSSLRSVREALAIRFARVYDRAVIHRPSTSEAPPVPLQVLAPPDDADAATPPDKCDDARQVITIGLAATARERAAADLMYTSGRNAVTVVGTLFTVAQVALLSSVGREVNGVLLLNSDERGWLLAQAVVAAVGLFAAIGYLFTRLGRPRPHVLV